VEQHAQAFLIGSATARYNAGFLTNTAITGITGETNLAAAFPWHALGMLVFFAVYFMRMKFSWFLIDPAGLVFALPYAAWNWFLALLALIVKLIVIKIIGASKFSDYVKRIVSGAVMGYGATVIFAWFANLTTVQIPNFQSYYVP